jgi:hypothetical protein
VDVASAHLARLGAISRPAGSASAAYARRYCADVLGRLGFTIQEQSFEYSKFPGGWATPLAGLLIPLFAAGITLVHSAPEGFGIALIIALVAAGALFGYVARAGVLDLQVMRRRGINLEAVRGPGNPTVWLVAHIDSKWQPVSMMMRVAGVIVSVAGLIAAEAVSLIGGGPDWLRLSVLVVTCVAAIPLVLSYVGDGNHGTLDNASGVAAVLEAVELMPADSCVGVLITDAEELALAGARAWARLRSATHGAPRGIAINCDSIDDDGPLTVMHSSPPPALLDAMSAAGRAIGEPIRVMRLIPGVLTDHVALADAGWTTLTLSRGTVRTLQRIHTSRDTLSSMRGTGISAAARVLAQTATELG